MDARDRKSRQRQPLLARLVFAALVVVLVLGLWQGYGAWLLASLTGGAVAHGS